MHDSKIEWVLNPDNKTLGKIWNPITGCLNHTNGLCKGGGFPCYAYRLANGRLRKRYLENWNVAPITPPSAIKQVKGDHTYIDPFYPRFWPSRVEDLFRDEAKKSKGIFVCDMGELFGDWIPNAWQESIFHAIRCRPWHRFYLLTKQPQNLAKFSPFPPNCWVGVTATDEPSLVNACQELHYIEAKIKYLSIEPLLNWFQDFITYGVNYWLKYGDVGQVIIGAQTKPYKPPEIESVREIVSAADHAGIPVFLKDNLKPLLPNRMPFYDVYSYWSEDRTHKLYENRLRQEMPL